MNDTIKVLFGLFGGLAIFIFGMNMMSECLQKVAGDKMKKILSMLTKNPLLGALAGAVTTAVLQSSSATTVMAIGFVGAGLMTLPQAISIILGANIGTTMTAQIIAFKITDYIYLFIALGFIIFFVSKKEKIRNIGQTIFAFGLLFEGIEIMGSVMKPLASSPVFTDLMSKVSGIPILGVCLGTIMTLVVQSSSATIAVLQNFASQAGPDGATSIIGLAGAIPILLGDNIGTTITALLASVGQSKDAKRTAVAHSVFNISGALIFIWIIKPFAAFIQYISPKGVEVEVIARQIANAHTTFNIVMTLIWLPLIGLLVKIVMAIIPDRKTRMVVLPDEPKYLDANLISQPSAALHLVSKEVLRVSQDVSDVLMKINNLTENDKDEHFSEIIKEAEIAHSLSEKINDYLSAMFAEGVMTEEQANESAGLLYILCDIDRIGYLGKDLLEVIRNQKNKKSGLSKEALKDLKKSLKLIIYMYSYAVEIIENGEGASLKNIQKTKEELMQLDDKMRRNHIARVGKKKCSAKITPIYNNILHDIDRMGNSCVNLVEMAQKGIGFDLLIKETEEENRLAMEALR
ncbi:MAG: Na/Pi cotransporter family protein [Agathobacter sp.]|nr:Na/Pi cotransporter family protein [Agathobacter sp.]